MKTALITGAAGFLGRHVTARFAREGWKVLGLDDLALAEDSLGAGVSYQRLRLPNPLLAPVLTDAKPDVCVHCAGSASVGGSLTDPAGDFRGNTVLTFELLEALRLHAPRCRFLLLSSAAVYGNPASLPVTEAHATGPLSPYGLHKLQSEMLCAEYTRFFEVPTSVVRIFSAYGPGLQRQVIWDICERVLTKGALPLHGTGHESRDFIHASDIARALHLLAETESASGETYNLASGREVTIAELAAVLAGELAPKIAPQFDGKSTPGNPLNWRADISKIASLGFAPQISLEEGLRESAAWARSILGKE
jgi:UDP-glucose 4-epimerase